MLASRADEGSWQLGCQLQGLSLAAVLASQGQVLASWAAELNNEFGVLCSGSWGRPRGEME